MRHPTPRSTGLALALSVAFAGAPAVFAQDAAHDKDAQREPASAPSTTRTPFDVLDANADGTISKDEAAIDPPLAQAFGTLDTDADGRLTPEEYALYAQGQS